MIQILNIYNRQSIGKSDLKKIRTLLVDNSVFFQKKIEKLLRNDLNIEIVGIAADAYEARDLIVRQKPNVLALEIELPRLNGLDFLEKLMPQYPLPVVILTKSNRKEKSETLRALNLGAVDFIKKPINFNDKSIKNFIMKLKTKLMIASTANVSHWKKERKTKSTKVVNQIQASENVKGKLIVIGASTGGTEATKEIITKLSPKTPGILVIQHMPKAFTKMYAENLDKICYMKVKEAQEGDIVRQGNIYIAPGDFHMVIARQYRLHLKKTP